MSGKAGVRRPYVRPMQGWWRRDPFFVRYMSREATACRRAVYAVILLVGVMRLAQGEAAWNGWLAALRNHGRSCYMAHAARDALPRLHVVESHAEDDADDPCRRQTRAGTAAFSGGWTATLVISAAVYAAVRWWGL